MKKLNKTTQDIHHNKMFAIFIKGSKNDFSQIRKHKVLFHACTFSTVIQAVNVEQHDICAD